MNDDPNLAAYLRRMETQHGRMQAQYEALHKRYEQLATEHADDKIEMGRIKAAVKKAAERIRYVEDIPGKRVPYFLQFQINIPGPSAPSVTLAGARLQDVKTVSQDGPFVCTTYLSAFLMKTFSIGPYEIPPESGNGRPSDPPAGTEVITPLTGRWRPVASTADPFAGAYVGYRIGALDLATALTPQTYRPGIIDFLFEIQDEGVDRLRQNSIPIPSRYLFSEFDRPLYLPVTDFFERSSSVRFTATLTRELGFAEVNYTTFPNGFSEGNQVPPPDPTAPNEEGRAVVALGGTLYFTMLGYKILQAQSPAV
jgi:hypothetical protein